MSKLTNIVLNTALVVVLYILFAGYGPRIEGHLLPVVAKLEITKVEEYGALTQIWVKYRKIRDCPRVGIAWYKGVSPDTPWERVGLSLDPDTAESDSNLPVGTHSLGPWTLRLFPYELRDQAFAVVTHKCHPLWLTRTVLYP